MILCCYLTDLTQVLGFCHVGRLKVPVVRHRTLCVDPAPNTDPVLRALRSEQLVFELLLLAVLTLCLHLNQVDLRLYLLVLLILYLYFFLQLTLFLHQNL